MKLQLKHLAPYLPYNLEVIVYKDWALRPNYMGYPEHKKGTILKFSHYTIQLMQENNPLPFKPVLRPLSDLTKEIKHDGEKFVPVNEAKYFYGWEYLWSYTQNKQGYFNVSAVSYAVVKKLFEWHFDVFNLIDNGLAIDINILK